MKAQDLRSKSTDELQQELMSVLKEQFNIRMQHATGQLSNTAQLKAVRRTVARIKTIMNEKVSK
ncbi:MAG: 50S ribosomal protein L29 [Thiomicrospira sp.]|jgi:large subunit ribosomal protein L29|nr:50S ribosomal protein L29 [Thiomicrospira sp.]